MSGSILVVDDDPRFGRSLGRALRQDGHRVEIFDRPLSARDHLEREPYDLIFAELVMPEIDGLELLERAKRIRPRTEFVLITGHPTVETVQAALRRGARDYLTKPPSFDDEVRPLVRQILADPTPVDPSASDQDRAAAAFDGVADSGDMASVLRLLPRIAATEAPVLIHGESGTGKELAARAIHRLSERAGESLVEVNCAALHEGLLEAELFGVAKGAYTGAHQPRPGYFEVADGGTLLLDEIAETTTALQAKLLRVLQEGVFHRVGDASQPIRTDVRLLAATNRDLPDEVAAGRFRLDLYYRLNVVPVRLPPLRERLRELPALIQHCAEGLGQTGPIDVEPDALRALRRHDWPGNIRELRNAIQHAFVVGGSARLRLEDLPEALRRPGGPRDRGAAADSPVERLHDVEVRQIREAMRHTGGNRSRAAQLLGVTRRVLGYRIRKFGLEEEFRSPSKDAQALLPFDETPH